MVAKRGPYTLKSKILLRQILADCQNSFNFTFSSKFAIKRSLIVLTNLKHEAALQSAHPFPPYQIVISEN